MHATTGPLDRLPAGLQHLLLLLAPVVLGWVASDVVPWLQGRGGWAAIGAGILGYVVLAVTPLTRQYGLGAPWKAEVKR